VPNFISNIYTRYEICFQYSYGLTKYAYCKPLTTFAYTGATTTFTIVCTSTGVPGMTAGLKFTPQGVSTLGNNLLTLTFTITASVATGTVIFDPTLSSQLPSGSNFPSSLSSTTQNLTISWNTAATTNTSTNLNINPVNTQAFTSSLISFNFPFCALQTSTTYTATTVLYFTKISDNAQFIVQKDVSTGSSAVFTGGKGFGTTHI
jgi:hypothetical protein